MACYMNFFLLDKGNSPSQAQPMSDKTARFAMVCVRIGRTKREAVKVSLFGVGGGARTHDLQIHNLAL